MSFQSVSIIGNLGSDPEMRYTADGRAVCNFSVATNRSYTNSKNEKVKETAWFRVSVWGKQAESCNQYLKKGSKAMIEGRLLSDPATGGPRLYDLSSGQKGASFEIAATQVVFLDPVEKKEPGASAVQSSSDDEVPW